jgi:hypothetical protein
VRFLTTKRLYRAFPELDHFLDEQCQAFVSEACRDRASTSLRWAIQMVVAIGTLAVVLSLSIYVANRFGPLRTDRAFMLGGTAIMFVSFGSAALACLLSRDVLLRRRIRRVMRSRGSCHECGYGLTGLPVATTTAASDSVSHAVICPECGTSHPADASLGETVLDARGTLRFVPSPNAPGRVRPGLVRRVIRHNARLAASLAVLVVLLVTIPVGGYEYFLSRQAAEARADILEAGQLHALVASTFPGLSDDSTSEDLHPFDRFRLLHHSLDTIPDQVSLPDRRLSWPIDPEQVAFLSPPEAEPLYTPEILAEIREDAALGLDALIRTGAFEKLDAIAALPTRLPMQADAGPVLSIYQAFRTPHSTITPLLSLNRARIRRAILDGDAAGVQVAIRTHLRLIGHLATVPEPSSLYACQSEQAALLNLAAHAIDRARATASRESMLDLFNAMLVAPRFPSQSQIQAIDAAITRSVIAYIFAEPSSVRFGKRSLHFARAIGPGAGVVVGTYASTLEEFEAQLIARSPGIDNDRFERPVPNVPAPRYAANMYLTSNLAYWLEFGDTHTALTRAVPLWVAIERYRLDHARLPTTLDELVPTYIAAIPIDPFSGKPLLYKARPLEPATTLGESYIIYSAGYDGVDHGGVFPPADKYARPLKPTFPDTPLIEMPPPASM